MQDRTMEFLLSFFLLALNLIDYEVGLNSILFLAVSAMLFVGLFFVVQSKTKNFLASCLCMFCHTWQISWINIFGDPTSELQLPWFYIIGVLVCIYAVFNFSEIYRKQIGAKILVTFVALFIVSVFPLLTSVSKTEGLKEYIMIIFFLIMVFIAFLFSDKLVQNEREHIINAYIWCVFISSVFIIIQAAAYHLGGMILFKFSIENYLGNTMTPAQLLMEDSSCATIMLGSAVFFILEKIEKKQYIWWQIINILAIVIGMALTSRRTSVISLIIILGVYAFFHYKGALKKTGMLILFGLLVAVMLAYLMISRPVDDLSGYLNDNMRFANYMKSLEIFINNPLGIGYDNAHLASLMTDNIIPHNTLLRWLVMGGIIFTVPMVIVLCYVVKRAFDKKLTSEYWVLIYSLFASNFIPDLLNARFFLIPCMCVMLFASRADAEPKQVKRYGS